MNNRGEKISRARILLRELSSLNDRSLEEMNQSQLQALATEYNALSSDPEIKDQFRRMEQSISISPTVIRVLKQAKENPGAASSLTSANSNSANDQAEQDFQVQQLREEYNRMSDAEKRNMDYATFIKFIDIEPEVKFHSPENYARWLQEDPSRILNKLPDGRMQYEVTHDEIIKGEEKTQRVVNNYQHEEANFKRNIQQVAAFAVRSGDPSAIRSELEAQYAHSPQIRTFVLYQFDAAVAQFRSTPHSLEDTNTPDKQSCFSQLRAAADAFTQARREASKRRQEVEAQRRVVRAERDVARGLDQDAEKITTAGYNSVTRQERRLLDALNQRTSEGRGNASWQRTSEGRRKAPTEPKNGMGSFITRNPFTDTKDQISEMVANRTLGKKIDLPSYEAAFNAAYNEEAGQEERQEEATRAYIDAIMYQERQVKTRDTYNLLQTAVPENQDERLRIAGQLRAQLALEYSHLSEEQRRERMPLEEHFQNIDAIVLENTPAHLQESQRAKMREHQAEYAPILQEYDRALTQRKTQMVHGSIRRQENAPQIMPTAHEPPPPPAPLIIEPTNVDINTEGIQPNAVDINFEGIQPVEPEIDTEGIQPIEPEIDMNTDSEEEIVVDPQNFGDSLFVDPFSGGYIEESEPETTDELQDEEELAVEEETRPDAENQEPTNVADQNENHGVSRTLASAGQSVSSVSRDIHINSYQDRYNR